MYMWLLGAEDGLYMLDVQEEELYQFSDRDTKRVIQIKVLTEESLIVLLAGEYQGMTDRHHPPTHTSHLISPHLPTSHAGRRFSTIRLLPLSALDSGDVKNAIIDISETKGMFLPLLRHRLIHSTTTPSHLHVGAHLFCTGNLGPTQYICVAVKNRAIIYELSRSKPHYERKKEVVVSKSQTIHCMTMFNDKLCVGYQSGFSLYNVYLDEPERSETELKLLVELNNRLTLL